MPIDFGGLNGDAPADPASIEIVEVELRDLDESAKAADQVKAMWENGMRLKPIAKKLGRSHCFVHAALKAGLEKLGLAMPKLTGPGAPKRAVDPNALYRVRAPEALRLYNENLPLVEISQRLKLDRTTLDKALKFEAARLGVPLEDGRARRKSRRKLA